MSQCETAQPVHSRYVTLGGAVVVMRADASNGRRFSWQCEGCQEKAPVATYEEPTRDKANAHAGACRSMPAG